MRRFFSFLFVLFVLASCTTQQPPVAQKPHCKTFEIPTPGGCCRDLNDNKVCDTADFAANLSEEQEQKYEEQAAKARERAAQSGQYKPTIVNELYENASKVANYKFIYKGDQIIVANGSVVRYLLADFPLGDQTIDGRRYKVVVNTVWLDSVTKTATAKCIPPAKLIAQGRGTQCDAYKDTIFDAPYDTFAVRLPTEWLRDFLYRTPVQIFPGNHVGAITGTLYRFTDLKDAHHVTNLWVDDMLDMPLRVEVWQDDAMVAQQEYPELRRV